jgi:CO/xanthine dehydrogenase Mo-binding subunit
MNAPVGQSVPRREAAGKLDGSARFVGDVHFEDVLHGVTVRSTIARGKIRNIRFDPTFPWQECTVVTAKDLPGPNVIASIAEDQPCLADSEVHHVAEAIVLIAHPDRLQAERARKAVSVEYDPLPAVFDPQLSEHVFKSCNIAKGDIAEGFRNAAWSVEGVYSTSAQEQMYMEPQGMVARHEDDTIIVWGSMQCPYFIHKALARLLPLTPRVIQMETGGGFGGKEDYPSMLAAHAALLAMKSGKTVRMIYDREEDIAATPKRHPSVVRHRTGLDAAGRLVAMEVDILLDGGAYTTLSPVVLSRGAIHSTGTYYCPNVSIHARAVATNHPPHGAFRGFGATQTLFAIERHMDVIAGQLSIDPVAIRRRNFLKEGQTTVTGQVLREPVPIEALLDQALEESSYDSKPGQGIAAVLHGAGFTGSGERYLQSIARLERTETGKIRILVSSAEFGQGANTTLSQIVASEMGIPLEDVEVAQPDTSIVPDSGPTVASRTTMIVGALLVEVAKKLKLPGVNSATAKYAPPEGLQFDDATYTGDAYPGFGWAVNIAEVDVDRVTGQTRLLNLVAVQDVGRILNPVLAAGQVEGGVAQGIGMALYEQVIYDNGRVANPTMSNYNVPTSVDLPPIRVFFQQSPSTVGPWGAKGLGELPVHAAAPAICNAIAAKTTFALNDLPITPERMLRCKPSR